MCNSEGYYGQLKPRSGLALRNEISVDAGVFDPGYTGVVYILLVNHSDKEFFVCQKGMRIGQIIFFKCQTSSNVSINLIRFKPIK